MTESLAGPARLNGLPNDVDDLARQAAALDAADPLADFRDQFVASDDPKIIAYFDGNSLGRPLGATRERTTALSRRSGADGSSVPGTRAGWTIRYASVTRSVAWC